MAEDYFTANIHDILMKCVEGHCNIIVSGETGSGKTEFVKYLASHTKEDEKIITIEGHFGIAFGSNLSSS